MLDAYFLGDPKMGRIATEEIERLKRETSVERLVTHFGVALVRRGADLVGCCPFHEDKTPSLVISPEKNLWHCLGACQVGGSAVDWVMRTQGLSFRHAVEMLRGEGGARLQDAPTAASPAPTVTTKKATVKKFAPLMDRAPDDQGLLQRVVEFYGAALQESPEALEYLRLRGINNAEAIAQFKLGFSNRTLGYLKWTQLFGPKSRPAKV
jgi:DNA primase